MKLRKRILSLVLAVMLVMAMAIPASASSYYYNGTYNSYGFELSDVCHTHDFSSITTCDSPNYGLKSEVSVWGWIANDFGELEEGVGAYYPGTTTVKANSTSGYVAFNIIRITCVHYINGISAYTTNVSSN